MLKLSADVELIDLWRGRFEGTLPEVKIEDGTITIRNRRRVWCLEWGQHDRDIALNTSIPWQIEIRGGAAGVTADLTGLDLIELTVSYGMSSVDLNLPFPSGTVPLRISGGASDVVVKHPAGVPVRVRFSGWASAVLFAGGNPSGGGKDLYLQSPRYEDATGRYYIVIAGNSSTVTISR